MSLAIHPRALEEALRWARERYSSCDVCAAGCLVDRHQGERGRCGLGADGRVYKEYLHLGEEETLVPSHAIYLTGCNLRCTFCSDWDAVVHPDQQGSPVAPERLAKRIAQRRREGATNVNFVGGLPDVNLLYILETLTHCPEDTHVVWNTNLWTTAEAIERLRGVVGTWLVDLKFGNDDCAKRLSGVEDYTQTLQRLLPKASQAGQLLVRHLLMPGHLSCCTEPALSWLRAQLPEAQLNVMTTYHPFALRSSKGPMSGPLPERERQEALALLQELDFQDPMVDGRFA